MPCASEVDAQLHAWNVASMVETCKYAGKVHHLQSFFLVGKVSQAEAQDLQNPQSRQQVVGDSHRAAIFVTQDLGEGVRKLQRPSSLATACSFKLVDEAPA